MIRIPHWLFRQITTDDTLKAVWCYCGAEALTYCRGSQFLCVKAHWGMPMVMLKDRPEGQEHLDALRANPN